MVYKKTKKCHLCGVELSANNKCESHIIPKFIWKEYMMVNGKHQEMILMNSERPKILRGYGVTDNGILCRKCDGDILGQYENDFREVWERIFKNGESHPFNHNGSLIGWMKKVGSREDFIKTKLFVLCCIWRASISDNGEHQLKLNLRKENAIRRELQRGNHNNLLHNYSMLCSRFEDGNVDVAIDPYRIRKNTLKTSLYYLHLPGGFIFIMRLGTKNIGKDLEPFEFGTSRQGFLVLNAGKMEGSKMEEALLKRALTGLREMYDSDKKEIKAKLLPMYGDLSRKDIDDVF